VAAINKRKVLESAQRNLQKGALDKALKDYQVILNADPRDTGVRLKCGDLLQRMGRNDEAIAAYLKVADQFQRDGFDAKAVALYKQVTKIDDKRHDIYVPLADLYQRLGLISEAMGALQTAADAFHRDGRKREALDLLRRMASLDPANVTSRLKVAELLLQEGLTAEAVAEFREAAAECARQGDWEARASALERVVDRHPECVDELEALGGIWLDHGQPRRAHQFAQKLIEADASRPESQELLARVLSALGQEELAIDAFRSCAEAWRLRGEEGKAREIVQRHLPPQDFSSLSNSSPDAQETVGIGEDEDAAFGAAGELGGDPGAGEGVFGSEPIEVGEGGAIDLGGSDLMLDPDAFGAADDDGDSGAARSAPEVASLSSSAPEATGPASLEAAPDGDVEQLLAEAAVYLRYRKHERAIASLGAVLQREPDNLTALEQLGEAHVLAAAPEQAVECWSRAARGASEAGEAARCVVLRGRIAELDATAAAELELPTLPPSADDASQPPADSGLEEIEIEIDADTLGAAISEQPETGVSASATPEDVCADEAAFELDLAEVPEPDLSELDEPSSTDDVDAGLASMPANSDGEDVDASALAPDEPSEAASEEPWELPPDHPGDEPAAAPVGPEVPIVLEAESSLVASEEVSVGAGPQIQEDFEEASFYFEQGLFAEAEAIYRRILERAPSHPGALLRLGEIAFQRGDAPGSVSDPQLDESLQQEASAADSAASFANVESHEPPSREEPLDIEPPDALDLTTPNLDDGESQDWADAIASIPEEEDSTANALPPGESTSTAPVFGDPTPSRVETMATVAEEPELTTPDLVPGESAAGVAFDLAAELSDVLSDPPSAPGAATDEDGFASLFRDFKRGVSQTLGEGDVETHFDLGIAYREMGLLEDAIGEFRYALGFPSRRLDALQLMGLCALDLGRGHDAVGHLEQALASPDVPSEREAPLRYELGRAYQSLPDRVRALEAFRRVFELDPDFQDVADRVRDLEDPEADAEDSTTQGESAEAYESFDDLVADAAAAEAPAPIEHFESFDDLVAEANDELTADAAGDAIDTETEAAFVEAGIDDDGSESRVHAEAWAHGGGAPDPISEPESEQESASTATAEELEVEVELESGSEPQPTEPATPPLRRRRKVSFV
jgi:tetratricopeptide (TPR) repeat protein